MGMLNYFETTFNHKNVVEWKVSARRRDNFRNEFIFLKSNRSICGKYKRQSRGLLFLVTGIVVVVTNGQRFRVFIQIPIAARTDGASCAGIPHDLH